MTHEYRHSGERYLRDADYLREIHPDVGAVLTEIEAVAGREGQPITERESARLLAFVVRAIGARRALEIGTNLGFSAIWIAGALPDDGRLITIDQDAEILARARRNFSEAGVDGKIQTVHGSALDALGSIEGPFDFAYIDANKFDYPALLDEVVTRLRAGGVVAIDNLLWLGQAAHQPQDTEHMRTATPIVREFNRNLLADARLDATIVQVGDGIGLGVKRG